MTSNLRTVDGDQSSNMEAIIYFNTIKWLPPHEKELFLENRPHNGIRWSEIGLVAKNDASGGCRSRSSRAITIMWWAAPSVYPTFSKLLGFASILFLFFPRLKMSCLKLLSALALISARPLRPLTIIRWDMEEIKLPTGNDLSHIRRIFVIFVWYTCASKEETEFKRGSYIACVQWTRPPSSQTTRILSCSTVG